MDYSLPFSVSGPQPKTPDLTKREDSEHTAIREDVLRLYRSSELPSVYEKRSFDTFPSSRPITGVPDLTFVNVPLKDEDEDRDMDPDVVWWEDDHDPDNPMNWPRWKKSINLTLIFCMCCVYPFASSVIAPAIPDIMFEFQKDDRYLSAFFVSIYVLGYAIGPLLISPLSELYGRVIMYHLCNLVFVGFTCWCATVHSLEALTAARFLAGCGGSSVFALAMSSVADMVPTERRSPLLALMAVGYNIGPAVAPVAGSYLNEWKGWRWVFWVTAIAGAICTITSFIGLSETYELVLLKKKATRSRKKENRCDNERFRRDTDTGKSQIGTLWTAVLIPLRMLTLSPNVFLISLLTAVGYSYMYLLYTTLPQTFTLVYGWLPRSVGLAYLGTAAGNLIGMIMGGGISDAIVKKKAARGDTKPENRIIPMIFFWPLVAVGLFVYAWTAREGIHYLIPLTGTAIFGAGVMSTIFFCGTYIIDAYTIHSASGMAASSVLRSVLGGVVPLFSWKLYDRFDVHWTFSILAFGALMLIPVPFIFYRFGERLRQRFKVAE